MSSRITKDALKEALEEKLRENWQSGGAGREALREELLKVSLRVSHPKLNTLEVTNIIPYRGKLYAAIAPSGEFYEFDGEEWRLAYTIPFLKVGGTRDNWRGGFWEARVFNGVLYFGGTNEETRRATVVSFDGTDWQVVKVFDEEPSEIYAMEIFGGGGC